MKKTKWIYILISLLPIIDVITSIESRSNPSGLSVGIIVKGLLTIAGLLYIVFLSKSKYKKMSLIYLFITFLYVIFYFGFKNDLLNLLYLKSEITYLFKLFYFPFIFLAFLNYFDEYGFNKKYFICAMKVTLILYALLLIIPLLTGTAVKSYNSKMNGVCGWFYAANEISNIVVLLMPILYLFIDDKHKYNFLISLPILFAFSAIGTKVSLIGCIFVSIIAFIYYLLKNKFKINNYTVGSGFILIFTLLFFLVLSNVTVNNIGYSAKKYQVTTNTTVKKPSTINTTKKPTTKTEEKTFSEKLMTMLLSNRNGFYERTLKIYNESYSSDYPLFGIGFSNTPRIDDQKVNKLIEIDYLDLYFHTGIVGLLLNLFPVLYAIIKVLLYLFIVKKEKNNIYLIFYLSIIIALELGIALIAGHVLFYPAVATYINLYLIFLLSNIKYFESISINNNRIDILALHLNYGGIETSLVNQANMLSEKYDVKIISLYNSHKEIPYKLNSNIKVEYLSNFISNEKEVKAAIKNHKLLSIIKECLKSIKILYLKPILIKKSILESDAKVVISTRKEFSKILGNNRKDNVILVGEEHNYHDNFKKYINSVIKCNKKIDYLLPASKELSLFYEKKCRCKVKYLPNVIESNNSFSNLNSNKIVCIGRLSKEKGYLSLIEVIKIVKEKNKDIILDIYGEGLEKENLLNKIKENNLEKNIILKGFVPKEEILQKLKDYSLIICTSYKESFGLSILEAMIHKVPCITFDSAKGPLEFINNSNGIIIKNRNISIMADSIINLLNNKKELSKLGNNSYLEAEKYTLEKNKEKYIKFIDEIIDSENNNHKNVMFISSTGGHLNELLQLSPLFKKYDYEIITEKTKTTKEIKKDYPLRVDYLIYGTKFHPIPYFLFILPINCFISLFYYFKYMPKAIITTGAHTAGPMCCIGKIFGSKIIYIETFANIETRTVTGKIVYKFADVFIVQWKAMLKCYPKAIDGGWIF